MSENDTKDTHWRELDRLEKQIKALQRAVSGPIPILSEAVAQPNTQYVDDLDGKLYFKDSAGVSHALY